MSHTIGGRASCGECGRILIYTSAGWKHAGVNQPRHMAIPVAMPEGAVWVGDAPDEDEEPEDKLLVDSGILPHLIEAAKNTPVSPNWQAELEAIG